MICLIISCVINYEIYKNVHTGIYTMYIHRVVNILKKIPGDIFLKDLQCYYLVKKTWMLLEDWHEWMPCTCTYTRQLII